MAETMEVSEKMLAAYNEAGHGIEALLQGRLIFQMWICPSSNNDGTWGGQTDDDPTGRPTLLVLPPPSIYERLERPVPQGFTPFEMWECCTFKLAAVEAEKRLCELNGIDSNTQRLGKQDIEDAKMCVANLPLEKAQGILIGAQAQARRVVEDPDCWKALELLAQSLIDAYERSESQSLTTREIHTIVSQALLLPPLDDDII